MKLLKLVTLWIPLGILIVFALAAYDAKTTDISAYCSYNCAELVQGVDGCDPKGNIDRCSNQCLPIKFPGGVCMPTDNF